jgi:hypothetical protein
MPGLVAPAASSRLQFSVASETMNILMALVKRQFGKGRQNP